MILQLTDYAVSVLASNPSPALDVFRIGSAFNYVPLPTDTNLHGAVLFTGQIAPPVIINANVVKYTVSMDTSIGDFDWGEVGFFYQGQLFALAVGNSLQSKIKVGVTPGNQVRLDAFLSVVGTNYAMIVDQADTNNQFQMASLSTIDQLPPTNQTAPNCYIISALDSTQSTFLAYTDRTGLWNFDAYQYASAAIATITAADSQSVTIALGDYTTDMLPDYFGQVSLQFASGTNYSICRYVLSAIVGGSAVLGFQTPMAVVPAVGDKIRVYRRVLGSATLNIPIASASVLGGIKIGAGLAIDPMTGVCHVDAASLGAVTSVNGKTGVVTLVAADIPGIATVGKTGLYSDLIGAPGPYTLPIATTSVLGGVKAPASGNLVVSGAGVIDLGFAPVKTVNGVGPDPSGNIIVTSMDIGLINPAAVPASTNLNTMLTTGLFTVDAAVTPTLSNAPTSTLRATLEIVPLVTSGTGAVIQRWTNDQHMWWRQGVGATWGAWNALATQVIATTTTVGVVSVGSGLSVDLAGVLSVDNSALPKATTSVYGVVKVGTGLQINGTTGALETVSGPYTLPIAGVGVGGVLGGVKIGTSLTIDSGTGLLNSKVQTVNGVAPDVSGNITVPPDSTKLDRVNGTATGLFLKHTDLGAITPGALVNIAAAAGNSQSMSFSGGTSAWTFTWPASGTYAEVQAEITNGGTATHTFAASVKWYNPDGTLTTNFTTYMTNKRGTTNFQASGVDFAVFWSRDGGSTIYAMVL